MQIPYKKGGGIRDCKRGGTIYEERPVHSRFPLLKSNHGSDKAYVSTLSGKKGNKYITPDVGSGNGMGSHNGGVWKMADSVKKLGSRTTRLGTYDANLNRIGN